MLAAIKTESINAENWKSSFLSFTSDWLDEIEKDHPMDSITDISKSLFQKRSQIMGQAALALIEKKFGHLLEQSYCECPLCDRVIKAKPEKVRREIDTAIGSVTLYRPYFYCHYCSFGFYPLDDALGLSQRKAQPDIQELEAWLAAEIWNVQPGSDQTAARHPLRFYTFVQERACTRETRPLLLKVGFRSAFL